MVPEVQQVASYVRETPALLRALQLDINALDDVRVSPLGQGEHNVNFLITQQRAEENARSEEIDSCVCGEVPRSPRCSSQSKAYVARINIVSQLGITNQTAYEYAGLCALSKSGRTPQPLFLDDSKGCYGNDVLVEEYIDGRWMDFANPSDIDEALAVLADIHSVDSAALSLREDLPSLLQPADPLRAQLDECRALIDEYQRSPLSDSSMIQRLEKLYSLCQAYVEKSDVQALDNHHIINTEAVPSHFLISPTGYGKMVDWEKPIIGEAAQDLAYFLSPTTTIWDTDYIFSASARSAAIESYCRFVDGRFDVQPTLERLKPYTATNCLRGLSWSARTWTQYQDEQLELYNEKTKKKLEQYLSKDFYDLCWDLVID